MEKLNVPELTGTNYFIWALKIKSALSLKRLDSVLSEVKPEGLTEKDSTEWDQKNTDAVGYIKLSLLVPPVCSRRKCENFVKKNQINVYWTNRSKNR